MMQAGLTDAAARGDAERVDQLLKAGAAVDTRGGFAQSTALYHAAHQGHVECVRMLVSAGADVNCVNNVRS